MWKAESIVLTHNRNHPHMYRDNNNGTLNKAEIHYEFQYRVGLDIDRVPFDPEELKDRFEETQSSEKKEVEEYLTALEIDQMLKKYLTDTEIDEMVPLVIVEKQCDEITAKKALLKSKGDIVQAILSM